MKHKFYFIFCLTTAVGGCVTLKVAGLCLFWSLLANSLAGTHRLVDRERTSIVSIQWRNYTGANRGNCHRPPATRPQIMKQYHSFYFFSLILELNYLIVKKQRKRLCSSLIFSFANCGVILHCFPVPAWQEHIWLIASTAVNWAVSTTGWHKRTTLCVYVCIVLYAFYSPTTSRRDDTSIAQYVGWTQRPGGHWQLPIDRPVNAEVRREKFWYDSRRSEFSLQQFYCLRLHWRWIRPKNCCFRKHGQK